MHLTPILETKKLGHILNQFGFWLGCTLLAAQGLTAIGYAWRFPVMDELSNFDPGMLERHLSWNYLLKFHNEHEIFLTRLLTWGVYRLFDSNPIVQVACNYSIFVGACFLLRHLIRNLKVPGTDVIFCSVALPVAVDVHNWAFQTHFYATFLVFLFALWALSRGHAWVHLAGPLAILGCLSFSAGIAFACTLSAVASCLAVWFPARKWAYMGVVAACALGVGWYVTNYPGHLPGHPPFAPPWRLPFWNFMAMHLGGALGCKGNVALSTGWVMLLGGTASLGELCRRAWRDRSLSQLVVGAVALGILSALAVAAIGRAGAEARVLLAARYTTYSLFFALLIWASQSVLFRGKNLYLGALALLLVVPMIPRFNYQRPYRLAYAENREAERCARQYYLGKNDGNCSQILPWSSARYLDKIWITNAFAAKELERLFAGQLTRYNSESNHSNSESASN